MRFASVFIVQPYCCIDTAMAKKNSVLLKRSDFHMVDNLLITFHAVAMRMLISLSVDKILLPMYVNLSTSFKGPPFEIEIAPCLKRLNLFICAYVEADAFCC